MTCATPPVPSRGTIRARSSALSLSSRRRMMLTVSCSYDFERLSRLGVIAGSVIKLKVTNLGLPIPYPRLPCNRIKRIISGWIHALRSSTGFLFLLLLPEFNNFPCDWQQLISRFGMKTHEIKQFNCPITDSVKPDDWIASSQIEEYR